MPYRYDRPRAHSISTRPIRRCLATIRSTYHSRPRTTTIFTRRRFLLKRTLEQRAWRLRTPTLALAICLVDPLFDPRFDTEFGSLSKTLCRLRQVTAILSYQQPTRTHRKHSEKHSCRFENGRSLHSFDTLTTWVDHARYKEYLFTRFGRVYGQQRWTQKSLYDHR